MKIDDLIKKYYDGDSTVEEEKFLSDFFSETQQESPESDMFMFFKDSKAGVLDDSFDEKVLNLIASENQSPAKAKSFWLYAAVAASIVLTFSLLWIFLPSGSQETASGIIITDSNLSEQTEIATEQTEIALGIVSSAFDNVNKKFNKLEYINKSDDVLNLLNLFSIDAMEN